ncbi:ester cyclase, partial [Planctomycetota bacterium]
MRNRMTCLIILLLTSAQVIAQTPDELIAVRNAYAKAMDDHDLDKMLSYWVDDGIYDHVQAPPPGIGKAAIRAGFEGIFARQPDFHTTEGIVLATGNIVVVSHDSVGTFIQNGNTVIGPHLDIYEFEGYKIKKTTTYGDAAGFMIQIGMMPAPDVPPLVPSITVPDAEPTGLAPMEANMDHINRWNSRDAALMAKIYSDDVKIFAGPMGMTVDRVAMTAMNEMYFSAFPDIELEVVRAIDLGNGWVVTELISHGTHQGPFMGTPAMGYPTKLRAVWLTRYDANGLLIEGSFYYDNMTLMTQMTTAPYPLDGIWISTIP